MCVCVCACVGVEYVYINGISCVCACVDVEYTNGILVVNTVVVSYVHDTIIYIILQQQ